MDWKTFDWKSQKVGQKGEVLTKTVYKWCDLPIIKRPRKKKKQKSNNQKVMEDTMEKLWGYSPVLQFPSFIS